MIELTNEGSYYNIGYSIGEQDIISKSSIFSTVFTKEQINFAYECKKNVKKHFLELLLEIQG